MLQYKEGNALAIAETGETRIIKLVLQGEFLEILEKTNPSKMKIVDKLQQINEKQQKPEIESTFAYSKLPIERIVEIDMSPDESKQQPTLGISVKGGVDFHLPILISRIIPNERADQSSQLFVGDAIIELNGHSLLGYRHRDAVEALRRSTHPKMTLKVRYLPHAATVLLNEGVFKKEIESTTESSQSSSLTRKKSSTFQDIKEQTKSLTTTATTTTTTTTSNSTTSSTRRPDRARMVDSIENLKKLPSEEYAYLYKDLVSNRIMRSTNRNWIVGLKLSLQYSHLTVFKYRYKAPIISSNFDDGNNTNNSNNNNPVTYPIQLNKMDSFIVRSLNGLSTGIISFKDSNQFHFWKEAIKFNINGLLIKSMKHMNLGLPKDKQVYYLGWIFTRSSRNSTAKFHPCNEGGKNAGAISNKCQVNCRNYHESPYENLDEIHNQSCPSQKDPMKLTPLVSLPSSSKSVNFQNSHHNHKSVYVHDDINSSNTAGKGCFMFRTTHPSKSQTSSNNNSHDQAFKSHEHDHFNLKHDTILNNPLFLVIQGIHILLFQRPPVSVTDWMNPFAKGIISRSMITFIGPIDGNSSRSPDINENSTNLLKHMNNITDSYTSSDSHQSSNESSCITLQTSPLHSTPASSSSTKDISPTLFLLQIESTVFHCMFDCIVDYMEFEVVWIRINYHAVLNMKVDSFRCTYQNVECILYLDFDYGLKLVSAKDGVKIWQFQFHQLKASSDDGENRLRLIFSDQTHSESSIDQLIHCHKLDVLLISIQSFLTAKLGHVDPHYFDR